MSDMPLPLSEREWILIGALLLIAAFSLASFFGYGRISNRMHAALASLCLLVAGFALLLGLTSATAVSPLAGAAVFVLLAALFKILNQFEITRKPPEKQQEKP